MLDGFLRNEEGEQLTLGDLHGGEIVHFWGESVAVFLRVAAFLSQ
jgi:hypothetical protein